jgi:hypothetical protein
VRALLLREDVVFLTIYFDGQFWIGLIECVDDARLSVPRLRVARHVFGAEPSDIEVLEFVQSQLLEVVARATVAVEVDRKIKVIHNPKRAAREAAKIMRQPIVSTKAQQALQLQHEQNKQEQYERTKAERESEEERRREIKREKAKQRHRGY